ncbi:MAG: TonB-dependent receptor [Betaproteobacteria bacterium]|nr:TonB-dependent receptor [Betaproteobacteria bacterium]
MSSIARSRRCRARGLLCSLAGLSWPLSQALAADFKDDAVLVTATRSPRPVATALADSSVISREEVAAAHHLQLIDLLARQPGVEVLDQGGPGSVSAIFLRGTNSQHTLILVDGVRVGSATTGTAAIEHIPLAQIDRIEIVRGPASALYGSDAIGGVIQIFTRSQANRSAAQASAGFGRYGQQQYSAGFNHSDERWQFGLQVSHDRSSGFSAIRRLGNTPPAPFDSFVPDRDGYRNESASGRLAYRWGGGEVAVFAAHTSALREFDAGTAFRGIESDQKLQRFGISGSSGALGALALRWQVARATDDLNGGFGGIFRTTQDQFQVLGDFGLGAGGSATLGLEHIRQQVDGTVTFTVRERDVSSAFGAWQWDVGRHHLQASARHDSNSQFGAFNSGSASYGFDLAPGLKWVASAGNAFRMPSFNDLYNPGPFATGNPGLTPERAVNLETGLRFRGEAWDASLTLFRNRIRDLIQLAADFSPVNVGEAEIRGAALQGSMTFGSTRLTSSIDLQDPEDADTGLRLRYRSHVSGRLSATWTSGPNRVSGIVRAQGDRFDDAANTRSIPGYATVDVALERALGSGWSAALRVVDLMDRDHFTGYVFGNRNEVFATPGRSAFLQLRYQTE